jgi:hypothetical protein
MTAGSFVFKLLYSAAPPDAFPTDILAGSLEARVIPDANGTPVTVRLLQIDIAVKDDRAGPTGWYFATYAYDTAVAGSSPWRRMVPVGLTWGNDPNGPPLVESWINPNARRQSGVGLHELSQHGAGAEPGEHAAAGQRRVCPGAAEVVPQPVGHHVLRALRSEWHVRDLDLRPHVDRGGLLPATGRDGDAGRRGRRRLQPMYVGRRESAAPGTTRTALGRARRKAPKGVPRDARPGIVIRHSIQPT